MASAALTPCASSINGRNRLACKLLMADLGQKVTVEALLGFPVIRDPAFDSITIADAT